MTTVLVADDSETILLLLRTRLELAGYEVKTAADGQEVTELIDPDRRGRPRPAPARRDDAAQIGHRRPPRAARRRRRHPGPDRQRPPGPDDADAPTDLGISGYLTKPIDFDLLLSAIAELTADKAA